MKTIAVKYQSTLKVYQFNTTSHFKVGDKVLVETEEGIETGVVVEGDGDIEQGKGLILRKMTKEDEERQKMLREKEEQAFDFCAQKIKELRLPMKLIGTSLSLDERKLTFYFTAEGRVDFRELLRELVAHFHKNIRLQQIGQRDVAKMLGGLGLCGRPLCCSSFLQNMESITLEMAKEQNLIGLGSGKISGACGKLMCCLAFEDEFYKKTNKNKKEKEENV